MYGASPTPLGARTPVVWVIILLRGDQQLLMSRLSYAMLIVADFMPWFVIVMLTM